MKNTLEEIIDKIFDDPDNTELANIAREISLSYLRERKGLCPKCGAHMANWKEMLNEDHVCK